ncbi:MAG: copper amine oxidase N-terminal domain-containing protein [Bacillota bacterium]|nr:copper amine oxidase N-terminal domain-containing protein [Bacillota bacterium]MDW7677038.1 copper amine oxidase N-terminal domain-containing protein [Bacillota bacterium]
MEVVENEEEDMEGLPDFVRQMFREKFAVMDRNKLTIQGNPFVSETPPVIKEGRTLIPVKAVVNALGAEVEWIPEESKVIITKEDNAITITIELILGERKYTVNGEELEMDAEAQVIGNRAHVPLRFIAIALGEPVEYDAKTKEVRIGKHESPRKYAETKLNQKSEAAEENDEIETEVELEEEEED